jgi:Flp pilus assembly protein TadG
MRHRRARRRRCGAATVESAVAYGVLFLLTIGLIVGGMGVFRYQETATLAREAARFASVHGGQYAKDNPTQPVVDKNYIITDIVRANAFGMDAGKLQVQITLNTSGGSYDWDNTASTNDRWPKSYFVSSGQVVSMHNTVTVTVSYTWMPEAFLVGPFTLTSTSVLPMSY